MSSSFRDAVCDALIASASDNPSVMVLSPDVARALRLERFLERFPNQYVSVGISEANMVGSAAGLASVGYTPVIVGFSMFVAEKPFEQIRNVVAYPNLNVKIIATHSGLCVGQDGATHQATEDIAVMRMLPGFRVLAACDVPQTKALVSDMVRRTGPAYLRLGRDKAIPVYSEIGSVSERGADVLRDGDDVAVFTTGTMVPYVLEASAALEREGIHASVVNVFSIKPMDEDIVVSFARRCRCVVTAEDHFIAGGLGGAICEVLCARCPSPVERVGVRDTFGESGSQDDLYIKYGLTPSDVRDAAHRAISRRVGG
ncbi:MAG: transketolase family protein [Synergistaceae bacterium]|jgi:transketolase|nr:transketolase family protein [Synergistaceae bacterium]